MPDGRIHSATTLAVICSLLSYSVTNHSEWGIFASIGSLFGMVCTPDLDVDSGAIPMSIMRQTGGDGLAVLWQAYWSVYARIMPHRSFWSHFPIVGTLVRVLYLLPLYILPLSIWTYFLGFPKVQIFAWFIGLAWADLLHYIMDFWIPRQLFPQNKVRS